MTADVQTVLARIRNGIALLGADGQVLRAFRIANLAMLMQMHRTAVKSGRRRKRSDGPLESSG